MGDGWNPGEHDIARGAFLGMMMEIQVSVVMVEVVGGPVVRLDEVLVVTDEVTVVKVEKIV
jgi:hypothetical protein